MRERKEACNPQVRCRAAVFLLPSKVGSYWSGSGADYHPFWSGAYGNGTNVSATGLSSLSATIAGGTEIAGKGYDGSNAVRILSGSDLIASFDFNFSLSSLNFSAISIANGTTEGRAYLSVNGIPPSALIGGKTLYLYHANPNYARVCVKSRENATADMISTECTDADDTQSPATVPRTGA